MPRGYIASAATPNSSARATRPPLPISKRRCRWEPRRAAATAVAALPDGLAAHRARQSGQNDAEELARNAGKIDIKQWPGTLIAYFLGQAKLDQLTPPSGHGGMAHARECNVSFFAGEQALAKKDPAEATRQFVRARAICNIHTIHYLAAGVELKRLGK